MFNDINFTIVYYESVKNYTLFTTVVCIKFVILNGVTFGKVQFLKHYSS